MSTEEANYTFPKGTCNNIINDDNVTIIKRNSDFQTKKMTAESVDYLERKEDATDEYKEIGQFLYMDVGRWGGDTVTGDAWTRRRNFGLVCGSGAILCNYDGLKGSSISKDPNLENIYPEVWKHPDIQKMKPLLKKLSESDLLGHVTVVNALVCTDEIAERPSSSEILVFLGDIHAPVMNIRDRTCLPDTLVNESCAGFSGNIDAWSRGRIKINDEVARIKSIEEDVATFLNKIKTLKHKPNIGEIIEFFVEVWGEELFEEVKKKLFKEFSEESCEFQQLYNLDKNIIWKDAYTIKLLKIILELLLESQQLNKWDDNEKITLDDAFYWFDLYHGDGKNRGVDIFQNAGGDLFEFITLLLGHCEDSKEQGLIPARLVQLGDLYDFWLGLKRAFDTINPQKMFSDSATLKFLEFWTNETLYKTSTSNAIYHLVKDTEALSPKFVYGNHDSYRSTSQWPYEEVSDHFEATGIWAEHGHQSDEFNQDSNAVIGWTAAIFGFFNPEARDLENPLRDVESWFFNTLCRRLICIRHAACLCQQKNKRMYIMGHTHEPLLKKVHVVLLDQEKSESI